MFSINIGQWGYQLWLWFDVSILHRSGIHTTPRTMLVTSLSKWKLNVVSTLHSFPVLLPSYKLKFLSWRHCRYFKSQAFVFTVIRCIPEM